MIIFALMQTELTLIVRHTKFKIRVRLTKIKCDSQNHVQMLQDNTKSVLVYVQCPVI